MHELYELKDKLCKELEEYGNKDLSAGALDVVDKLAHTIKNLDKIIETYDEEGYSNADGNMMGGSYYRGGSYRGSYARGRGRNARRDSMGRYSSRGYSRDDGMIAELHEIMNEAPNDRTRQEVQKLIDKLESMA